MEVVERAQALRRAINARGLAQASKRGEHRAPLSQVVGQWGEEDEESAAHERELGKLRKSLLASVRSLFASARVGERSSSPSPTLNFPTPIPSALHSAVGDALVGDRAQVDGARPSAKALLSAIMLALEEARNKRGYTREWRLRLPA